MSKQPQKVQNIQSEFFDVLKQIQETRQKVFTHINTALIELYWQIGQIISQKVSSESWGKSVVSELANYITQNAPEIKGFSDKNLWRMKQFYETYQSDPKLSPLVRELPWTHNTIIFSHCLTPSNVPQMLFKTPAAQAKQPHQPKFATGKFPWRSRLTVFRPTQPSESE